MTTNFQPTRRHAPTADTDMMDVNSIPVPAPTPSINTSAFARSRMSFASATSFDDEL
jgi:hypothetical protein